MSSVNGNGYALPGMYPSRPNRSPMSLEAPPLPGTSGGSRRSYEALHRLLTGFDAPHRVPQPQPQPQIPSPTALIEALRRHAIQPPRVQPPRIELPDVVLPRVDLPDVDVPSIEAPVRVEAPAPVPRTSFMNPTLPADAPDPTVVRGDDGYFYAHTTQVGELNFPTLRSKDLTRWEFVGDAMPVKPGWVAKDTWAPKTVKTGDHYTMFYSGRGHDDRMRIGYATAATPAGPFQDRGVLVEGENPGYTIDPEIMQDGDRTYLYWGSANGDRNVEGIRGQEIRIEPDGAISRLGEPVVSKWKAPDDRLLVEAPTVTKHGDSYYMFYSDGHYLGEGGNSYALNVARGDSPLGPFDEHRRVIGSAGQAFGPGHNSMITDDAGQDWTVYHARIGSETGPRQMMMDRVDWIDGWPVVNGGNGPTEGPQPGPVIQGPDDVDTRA